MRKILFAVWLVFICSCGSGPNQIPEWQDTAFRQLENYKTGYLGGKEGAAEAYFHRARNAAAAGNDLNLLGKVYLTRYALRTAALEDFDDEEFISINKLQPVAANFTYYNFLKGNFSAVEDNLLPAQYSKIIKLAREKKLAQAHKEILTIDDSLSRLIACGIWIKYLPYDENSLQIAINTSAEQGWTKPLWAYLTQLQNYYLDRGQTAKAENIKERLELLKK